MTKKPPSAQKKNRPTRRNPTLDALEQIRTLLVGPAQHKITTEVATQVRSQRAEAKKRSQKLRNRVDRRSQELAGRLTKLGNELRADRRRVSRLMASTTTSIERAQQALRRESAEADRQLEARVLAMLERSEQRLTAAIEEMQKGKTDRNALASLFVDFAQRVGGRAAKQ